MQELLRAIQNQFFQEMYKTISKERLGPYLRSNFGNTAVEALALYMYNAALSEALYVPLHNFEVCLRNRLHEALSRELHTPEWYIHHLDKFDGDSQLVIEAALRDAKARKGDSLVPGDVIASLNLGFWTALFHEQYKPLLKSRYTDLVFPDAPPEYNDEDTKKLYDFIDKLRILRNRAFHYERIWNLDSPNLTTLYQMLLNAIRWMSPDLLVVSKMEDRFLPLIRAGRAAYQGGVSAKAYGLF